MGKNKNNCDDIGDGFGGSRNEIVYRKQIINRGRQLLLEFYKVVPKFLRSYA